MIVMDLTDLIKGTVQRDFDLNLSHNLNQPRPLTDQWVKRLRRFN